MFLVSRQDQQATIAGETFCFAAGEAICTEYSHKYRPSEFAGLAASSGFTLRSIWTDPQNHFAVLHLTAD